MIEKNTKFKETKTKPEAEGWQTILLSDAVDFSPKRELKKGKRSRFVTMANLETFTKNISFFETKDFSGGSKFKNGDTLMARITPCLENGKTSFVDFLDENEVAGGSTEFIVLCGKENISDSSYVYYLSISPKFRELAIKAMTGTSGRQRVENQKLLNHEISLPPLIEQKQIAEILSSLDDKIELNRKINANLEKLASALFKQWFVDFEFPDENGQPYKSNGGKMIDSELGEIPVNFQAILASSLFDFVKGVEPGSKKYLNESLDGTVPFYRVGDMFNGCESNIYIYRKDAKLVTANYDDVLLSTDGTVGRVVVGISGAYSSGIRKVIASNHQISNSFTYFWLNSQYVQDNLLEYASAATTIAHASGAIKNLYLCYEKNLVINFGAITLPVFELFVKNLEEINKLRNLRDSILPKLMSGKIRVNI